MPTFSPGVGTYSLPQEVTIPSATLGATLLAIGTDLKSIGWISSSKRGIVLSCSVRESPGEVERVLQRVVNLE